MIIQLIYWMMINKYISCGLCKYHLNEYFCENCNINICKNCYKNCNEERHKIQSLEKFKDKFKEYDLLIRKVFKILVIPLKEEENIINENNIDIKKEKEDNFDICLIYNIISLDYNNYFHYKNVENILIYLSKNYLSFLQLHDYEGKGKKIFINGSYYIGQCKKHLRNGKGILYDKNGNILYEGDYVDDQREGNGKVIFENGS